MRPLRFSNNPFLFCCCMGISFFMGTTFHSLNELTEKTAPNESVDVIEQQPVKIIEPACPPLDCSTCKLEYPPEPQPQKQQATLTADTGANFDELIASVTTDAKATMDFFNKLCTAVTKSSTDEGIEIGVQTIIFCYQHTLTYRRKYNYDKERDMGYYYGVDVIPDLPPYQMDLFQYSAIHAVISSIPAKVIKDSLVSSGNKFQDDPAHYDRRQAGSDSPHGTTGPRVLFWGCGADTKMHALLIEYLGGNITFIDNSAAFIETCKKSHPDIRLIEPTGENTVHTALIDKFAKDGSTLDTDDVTDALTESQWMENLDGIETELPWDIIVVDGPAQALGRSQPLYMAKRLAQSYPVNHFTHIFLHDASRNENCIIANVIMGHDPKEYMGNTLPRKGLKHWRVEGRNRKLPPTKSV